MGIVFVSRPACSILDHAAGDGPPAVALIRSALGGPGWLACCSGCLTALYHLAAALGDGFHFSVFRLHDFNHLEPPDQSQHLDIRQRSHPPHGR